MPSDCIAYNYEIPVFTGMTILRVSILECSLYSPFQIFWLLVFELCVILCVYVPYVVQK